MSFGQNIPTESTNKIPKEVIPGLNHVFRIDWDDNGILEEVVVVKECADGTIFGIPVKNLHPIDMERLRKVIVSVHSDKYEMWDLLSQGRLSNGMNSLDFFHENYVKQKRPRGSIMGGSFASLSTSIGDASTRHLDSGQMIGQVGDAQIARPGEY